MLYHSYTDFQFKVICILTIFKFNFILFQYHSKVAQQHKPPWYKLVQMYNSVNSNQRVDSQLKNVCAHLHIYFCQLAINNVCAHIHIYFFQTAINNVCADLHIYFCQTAINNVCAHLYCYKTLGLCGWVCSKQNRKPLDEIRYPLAHSQFRFLVVTWRYWIFDRRLNQLENWR